MPRANVTQATSPGRQRVVIAGVDTGDDRVRFDVEMDELGALANAAGADVVARIVQRRPAVDAASLIGSGKVAEIAELARANDASTVLTLNALRPRQRTNLLQVPHPHRVIPRPVAWTAEREHVRNARGRGLLDAPLICLDRGSLLDIVDAEHHHRFSPRISRPLSTCRVRTLPPRTHKPHFGVLEKAIEGRQVSDSQTFHAV